MCIRDSLSLLSLLRFLSHSILIGFNGWKRDTRLARGGLSLCLLYTSDAADERSSVDLGGRRIIKKKKTKPS